MYRIKRAVKVIILLSLMGIVLFATLTMSCGSAGETSVKLDRFNNDNRPVCGIEELHITGAAPELNIADYRLVVEGAVVTPLALTYEDILAYPTVTEVVLLVCPGYFTDNAEWTGVPVTTLLNEAGVKTEATKVIFHAIGTEYRVELPLNVVRQDGVFLAHTVSGQVLPEEHGYPLRLVVKGNYGYDWIKWLDRIEII